MGNLLSSKGNISSHFQTIRQKLQTLANMIMFFRSIWSKYKIMKIGFYDVIGFVLYQKREVLLRGYYWQKMKTALHTPKSLKLPLSGYKVQNQIRRQTC